ncbi:MAG: alpha/beta fold hydrolase [Cyanobacteriota bacterium]|nr:alpha/beta fold hydrolase [Cyanobacteriota bacterium]
MHDLLPFLELEPFRQRFPWLGPDLQTLRDSLRPPQRLPETGQSKEFALPDGDRLFARLDCPAPGPPRGLVVSVHGLGGCSEDGAQRRMGRALSAEGFAVLRLNLRGAGPGRPLARGTYAAGCSVDLHPVLRACRGLAADLSGNGAPLPLGAAGISLGGTVLLNALLDSASDHTPLLDALVGISSPLDLTCCATQFERPRNRFYQSWMVRRLIQQTLADPLPLPTRQRQCLTGPAKPTTIRAFDALITAPRWGYADVDAYYEACSPLARLRRLLGTSAWAGANPPPLLLLHAKDDPWVPVEATLALAQETSAQRARAAVAEAQPWPEVVITASGGHCGFHAQGDQWGSRWSDRLVARWLRRVLAKGQQKERVP